MMLRGWEWEMTDTGRILSVWCGRRVMVEVGRDAFRRPSLQIGRVERGLWVGPTIRVSREGWRAWGVWRRGFAFGNLVVEVS